MLQTRLLSGCSYALGDGIGKYSTINEDKIGKVVVKLEPDARGQQVWTKVHDGGSVEAVTKRAKTRDERDDVVVLLYDVQMLN